MATVKPGKKKMWLKVMLAALLGAITAKLGPEAAARIANSIDTLLSTN